jgi:hypothetical protein
LVLTSFRKSTDARVGPVLAQRTISVYQRFHAGDTKKET